MQFTIQKTRRIKPMKVLLYGTEGIGKTTFASNFPDPIFIDTERSTGYIDANKLPDPDSWEMLLNEVHFAAASKPGKTLVIDTADWAEHLAKKFLLKTRGWKAIDSEGYGMKYVALENEIKKLLAELDKVIDAGMNVVLLAHTERKKQEAPEEMGSFDRHELKLERRDAALLKEWVDMVLFANYKITVVTDGSSKKATGGERVLYTTHHPAWDAKNRLGLPDSLPFDYEAIREPFEKATMPPKQETSDLIPQRIRDRMQTAGLTDDDMLNIFIKGNFIPPDASLKDVSSDLWGHILRNWDKAINLLNN